MIPMFLKGVSLCASYGFAKHGLPGALSLLKCNALKQGRYFLQTVRYLGFA
jgi:hypothetical protein